ncbi:transglutaminase-like domain-containing protein [Roseibacillus ishigakijimensis]|uniref:Transglutaminase domain-containing protein n=1 Tax=Roseibacillus ishigakijimensis TaxID=454146 RepID=A0A934RPK5_9BACT|nr:transglutaminase-like domain-containing protein [Roseibacillus ishigakijimensis]MBK1835672.1 transglutaminase domain-containing protein [Roseibacillus ishigakijimensis]
MMLFLTCYVWQACAQFEVVEAESGSHVLVRQVLEEQIVDSEALGNRLESVVSRAETTKQMASAVSQWIEYSIKFDETGERELIKMGAAEDRPKNALQLLEAGEGACREFCLCFVSCMRAIGIPARHVVAFWKYSGGGRHFAAEYWDREKEKWVIVEPLHALPKGGVREKTKAGGFNFLVWYALDSYPEEVDPYGRDDLSAFVNVSHHYADFYEMKARVSDSFPLSPESPVKLSLWNEGSWRAVLAGESVDSAESGEGVQVSFQVADCVPLNRPILFTAVNEGELRCAFAKAGERGAGGKFGGVEGGGVVAVGRA